MLCVCENPDHELLWQVGGCLFILKFLAECLPKYVSIPYECSKMYNIQTNSDKLWTFQRDEYHLLANHTQVPCLGVGMYIPSINYLYTHPLMCPPPLVYPTALEGTWNLACTLPSLTGTWDQACTHPRQMTDRRRWNHSLPAATVAVGKYQWWSRHWVIQSDLSVLIQCGEGPTKTHFPS